MKKNKTISTAIEKNNKFFAEFKKFALKGNVIELAIGIIIGGAFGKIVSSLVADILTPLISVATGGVNIKDLTISIFEKDTLNYGIFLQNIIDFAIISFSVFLFIKAFEKMKGKKEEAPPKKSDEILLLTEIRDLLKEQKNKIN